MTKTIEKRPASRRRSAAAAALLAGAALAAPFAAPTLGFAPSAAHARQALSEPFRSYADLVEAMKPAVVTVRIRRSGVGGLAQAMPDLPDGPFGDFFRRYFEERRGRSPQPEPEMRGAGSGFIIDPSGLIVTNNHVIENATEVTVVLDNGDELTAKVLGSDPKTDIAVIKVEADAPLPTAPWGDSDKVRVGDPAVAIGNPFGLGGSVTAGIVSARGRDINAGPYDDFIQVDAAINRGNSGGPLFNEFGGVIGVNTAIISPSGGNIGLGFAIPSNQAKAVAEQIIQNGYVERGLIGVSIQPVTKEIADSLGLKAAEGALVAEVTKDGPADSAGVKPGDVVLRFNGGAIREVRDLTRAVAATAPGTETTLTVWRRGAEQRLDVAVDRMSGEQTAAAAPAAPQATGAEATLEEFGLTLGAGRGGAGALVTNVAPGGAADRQGILPGDRILQANQRDVAGPDDVAEAIAEAKSENRAAVLLMVERDGAQRFLGLPLK